MPCRERNKHLSAHSKLTSAAGDELWTLTSAMCQGTLTPAGAERLESLLQDEAARRFYVGYLALHARLLSRWRGADESVVADLAPPDAAPLEAAPPPRARLPTLFDYTVAQLSHPLRFSLLVATVTIASLLLTSAQIRMPGIAPIAEQHGAVVQKFVARFLPEEGARWEGESLFAGAHLRPQQQVRLIAGRAELRFDNGARVALQAPIELRLDSAHGLRLDEGTLMARVPPAASGFYVDAQRARIVDLGTEFGVSVDRQRGAEVHVFDGEVRIEPFDASRKPTLCVAGQAVVLLAHGRMASAPANAAQFPRLRGERPDVRLDEQLDEQHDGRRLLARDHFAGDGPLWGWEGATSRRFMRSGGELHYDSQGMGTCFFADVRQSGDPLHWTDVAIEAEFRSPSDDRDFFGVLARVQPDATEMQGWYMARVIERNQTLRLTKDLDPNPGEGQVAPLNRPFAPGETWRLRVEAIGPKISARLYDQDGVEQAHVFLIDETYSRGTAGLRLVGDYRCRSFQVKEEKAISGRGIFP